MPEAEKNQAQVNVDIVSQHGLSARWSIMAHSVIVDLRQSQECSSCLGDGELAVSVV